MSISTGLKAVYSSCYSRLVNNRRRNYQRPKPYYTSYDFYSILRLYASAKGSSTACTILQTEPIAGLLLFTNYFDNYIIFLLIMKWTISKFKGTNTLTINQLIVTINILCCYKAFFRIHNVYFFKCIYYKVTALSKER